MEGAQLEFSSGSPCLRAGRGRETDGSLGCGWRAVCFYFLGLCVTICTL